MFTHNMLICCTSFAAEYLCQFTWHRIRGKVILQSINNCYGCNTAIETFEFTGVLV